MIREFRTRDQCLLPSGYGSGKGREQVAWQGVLKFLRAVERMAHELGSLKSA